MPKVKCLTASRLRAFGQNVISANGLVLLCKVCKVKVAAERFTIQQHIISRDKHKNGVLNQENKTLRNKKNIFHNVLLLILQVIRTGQNTFYI